MGVCNSASKRRQQLEPRCGVVMDKWGHAKLKGKINMTCLEDWRFKCNSWVTNTSKYILKGRYQIRILIVKKAGVRAEGWAKVVSLGIIWEMYKVGFREHMGFGTSTLPLILWVLGKAEPSGSHLQNAVNIPTFSKTVLLKRSARFFSK